MQSAGYGGGMWGAGYGQQALSGARQPGKPSLGWRSAARQAITRGMQPHPDFRVIFDAPSASATEGIAHVLAPLLCAGDVLLLNGPVGAGKTHFARAVIQTLLARDGWNEDVPSPTYTLVQGYETSALQILHADLYRLAGPADVAELGLDQQFATALCLIEWPDRLGSLRPPDALDITLRAGSDDPDARLITLSGAGGHWGARLAQLCHASGASPVQGQSV